MNDSCPKCNKPFSFLDKLSGPSVCSDCWKSVNTNKKNTEQAGTVTKFSLWKLSLSLIALCIGGIIIYWSIYTLNSSGIENWFDGPFKGSGIGLFVAGVLLIAVVVYEFVKNLVNYLKHVYARRNSKS